MRPRSYDIVWVRGTTEQIKFGFKAGDDAIPADDVRFTAYNKGGKSLAFRLTLENNMGVSVDSAPDGRYLFSPTAEQTRSLTQTKADGVPQNTYEIELRNGASERVYVLGTIDAIGGINDDESDAS